MFLSYFNFKNEIFKQYQVSDNVSTPPKAPTLSNFPSLLEPTMNDLSGLRSTAGDLVKGWCFGLFLR